MIFYKPVTDRNEISKLFSEINLESNKQYGAYVATENDNVFGKCLVMIDENKCYVSNISVNTNDSLNTEGLIRSALNFAANRGAYIAVCNENEQHILLEKLGFKNNNGIFEGEIPVLLQGSCSNQK